MSEPLFITKRRDMFKATGLAQSKTLRREAINKERRVSKARFASERRQTQGGLAATIASTDVLSCTFTGLGDITTAVICADVETLSTAAASVSIHAAVICSVLARWRAWWQTLTVATCMAAGDEGYGDGDDDNDGDIYSNVDVDVDIGRTNASFYVDAAIEDARATFLEAVSQVVVRMLPALASTSACMLGALNLLHSVLCEVTLQSECAVPYLLCVMRGAGEGADEACIVEAARCLRVIMAATSTWRNEDVVKEAMHACRRSGSLQCTLAMLGVLTESLRACSPARLALLVPFLFEIVQSSSMYDAARAEAMYALTSITPAEEAVFSMLRSCGVLSYAISVLSPTFHTTAVHASLLHRALQFIGTFTDEHHVTMRWATELGLVSALATLCEHPSTLPYDVVKEVLWILADLASSCAVTRSAMFAEARLVSLPSTVLLLAQNRSKTDGLRSVAASVTAIVMENADAKVIQYMLPHRVVEGLTRALIDGVPADVALNVLTTLEDMFQLAPESLSVFVACGGIQALQATIVSHDGHPIAYQAHRIAETYALTD